MDKPDASIYGGFLIILFIVLDFFFHTFLYSFFSDLLVELSRSDIMLFYGWMAQKANHLLAGRQIKVGEQTPRFPPILFFRPNKQVNASPGIYFTYDPAFDFTLLDLKYCFAPVLEYIRCLVVGCPTMDVSFEDFLNSWQEGRGHPTHVITPPEEMWRVCSSDSAVLTPGLDFFCTFECRLCQPWSLALH